MTGTAQAPTTRSLAPRVVLFAALWLLLTGAEPASLWLGVPVIVVAAWISLRLVTPVQIRPLGLARFVPLFLFRSLVAGWDVALRALGPGPRLAPVLVDYETTLGAGLPRVFFANALSLLPGTLSADLDGPVVRVHLLYDTPGVRGGLRSLETAVARLFAARRG